LGVEHSFFRARQTHKNAIVLAIADRQETNLRSTEQLQLAHSHGSTLAGDLCKGMLRPPGFSTKLMPQTPRHA
jgi:hypothetical protein